MGKEFIDIHCHPSLKPFGRSFAKKETEKRNSPNRIRRNSIYHRGALHPLKKKLNNFFTLTKFTQSDFTSIHNGRLKIVVAALYPMEKNMILDNNGVQFSGRLIRNLATGIGLKRTRHLQLMPDYFIDLEEEYDFYRELDNKKITKGKRKVRYKLVRNYNEIEEWIDDGIPTIFVILSIEGCHVFNTGLKLAGRPQANQAEVLSNIQKVKKWDFPPFFIGLAHHFENELCGHEKSMGGIVDLIIGQKVDKEQGITDLGYEVVNSLLSTNNGKRILLDIKHMNVKSRYEYYEHVKQKFTSKIPIIVSHGAVNGRNNPEDNNRIDKSFNDATINFYDDEIFRIARSEGIFGIQLDERRIANKRVMGLLAGRNKSSLLVWKQIEHIGKYLDLLGFNAWDIQCLGTDFDGIIDPLPGFWTAKDLDYLPKFIKKHAQAFLDSDRGKSLKQKNKLAATEISNKFMFENAESFMQKHFK